MWLVRDLFWLVINQSAPQNINFSQSFNFLARAKGSPAQGDSAQTTLGR